MQCSLAELQKINNLSNVPQEQLDWLRDNSMISQLSAGEFIFEPGDPIDQLYLLIHGRIEIKIEQNGQYRHIAYMEPLSIGGALPYSRASLALGYGEVLEDCKVLSCDKSKFKSLTQHYELTEALVHHMTTRVREFTKNNVQQEKMMALGKLSAGLAHELNNPSSAMRRSAIALKKNLALYPEKFKRVMLMDLNSDQVDPINDMLFERLTNKPENRMSLLERTDKEDELADYLDDHDVEDADLIAETLLEYCFTIETCKEIKEVIGDKDYAGVMMWIANVLTTEDLVNDIESSSERIESLVTSVKGYTHMDRAADKATAHVHDGLNNTLAMLKHKLNKNSVKVVKNYCDDCPKIPLYVSEMNQVWTNIIDNAIDAMPDGGTLTIDTILDDTMVVKITDSGTGIPDEVIEQIFDPFFTTKEIGKGTGMGLELSRNIIHQHDGKVAVTSSKNGTTFTITLPSN